jgi:hypothetical protein
MVALQTHTEMRETKVEMSKTADAVVKVQHQTDGLKDALVAATLYKGNAEGEKKGVVKGIAVEKERAAIAKENQVKGAAAQAAKPFWQR